MTRPDPEAHQRPRGDAEAVLAIDTAVNEALERGNVEEAATLAVRGHGPSILRFLYGLLRNESSVEEAYAQFCEDLWRGIRVFRGQSAFRTYAFQLAHNAACRHLKDPFRRRGQPVVTADLAHIVEQVREATAIHRRTTVRDRLAGLRAKLAPDEQALLVLRIDQKMGWREVAEVLSSEDAPLDAAATRKRFERLKLRLRELAEAEGLIAPSESN